MAHSAPALLALEDGRVFRGTAVGATGEAAGEVVFNTCMTGYQEVLTDPSYRGQIVAMTYPLIGNCGVNPEDVESRRPFLSGFVMRECCRTPSNWRATQSLPDYLTAHNVIGIDEIDTRALTRHIREAGAMRGVLSSVDGSPDSLVAKAQAAPGLLGRDLVQEVTTEATYVRPPHGDARFRVVAFDLGVKYNILHHLISRECEVIVVPAQASLDEVRAHKPDGLFLSNGPGDPEGVPNLVPRIRTLIEEYPTFGICLGHQMLSLALGLRMFKLPFGHHGGNQPIRNIRTGRIEIAAENHGFAAQRDSLPPHVQETHLNLNDETLEGIRHRDLPCFSVQFHPEASPGPHDSAYLFDEFMTVLGGGA